MIKDNGDGTISIVRPAVWGESDKPVAWIDPKELDMDVSTTVTKNKQFDTDVPLYLAPQKYCPSENNAAYEKGFIDGMAKQRDSAVQRFIEGELEE